MGETARAMTPAELEKISSQREVSFAKKGIIIALFGAVFWGGYGVIMNQAYNYEPYSSVLYSAFVLSIGAGLIQETTSSIIVFFRNLSTGKVREYGRIIRTRPGHIIMIGAVLGGPLAVSCSLLAIKYCGAAYTLVIGSTTPAIASLLGVIFLKEKTNLRFWAGLALVIVGGVITSYVAPDNSGYPQFYLGILFAVLSAVAWGAESFTGSLGTDSVDSEVGVGIRYCTSAACYAVIAACCGAFRFIGEAFEKKTALLIAVCAICVGTVGVILWYVSFNMTGCSRAAAINSTYGFWNIVLSLIATAFGLVEVLITRNLILGCVIIIVGIVLVIANPKDLLSLRK